MEWGKFSEEAVTAGYNYQSGHYKVFVDEIMMGKQNLLNKSAMEHRNGITIDTGATSCLFP